MLSKRKTFEVDLLDFVVIIRQDGHGHENVVLQKRRKMVEIKSLPEHTQLCVVALRRNGPYQIYADGTVLASVFEGRKVFTEIKVNNARRPEFRMHDGIAFGAWTDQAASAIRSYCDTIGIQYNRSNNAKLIFGVQSDIFQAISKEYFRFRLIELGLFDALPVSNIRRISIMSTWSRKSSDESSTGSGSTLTRHDEDSDYSDVAESPNMPDLPIPDVNALPIGLPLVEPVRSLQIGVFDFVIDPLLSPIGNPGPWTYGFEIDTLEHLSKRVRVVDGYDDDL